MLDNGQMTNKTISLSLSLTDEKVRKKTFVTPNFGAIFNSVKLMFQMLALQCWITVKADYLRHTLS